MLLAAAVLLFSLLHLVPVWQPNLRKGLAEKLGDMPVKGLIALGLIGSVYLITLGWSAANSIVYYDFGIWPRHLNLLLTAIAFILFATSILKTWFATIIRNQQLTAIKIWAVGHILANGDSHSLILFGGLLIWAVLMVIGIKKRDGAWQKPDGFNLPITLGAVLFGLGVWYFVAAHHGYFFNVVVLPDGMH